MSVPEIVIVVAVAANGVIGRDGELPWHRPADLAHFKRLTTGHPVVMGRRTYESIVARLGHPLPDRVSVVLSHRDLDLPEGAVQARSVEEAVAVAASAGERRTGIDASTVYVAGGASVYEQFLPLADRMERTELAAAHEGDTTFPAWDRSAWRVVGRDERDGLAFVSYERIDADANG
ncbi:MAG: dihydrofolate reductase [Halobacteriaceae archaeon]